MMRPEDWSGLAPERDRPQVDEFDWTPEALNLSDAAAYVVLAHRNQDADTGLRYRVLMGCWSRLCGMDEAASLTYAYSIADAVPPVIGTVVPF